MSPETFRTFATASVPVQKPVPQNWQVQEINGASISDHDSEAEAQHVASNLASDLQRGFRVRRTS